MPSVLKIDPHPAVVVRAFVTTLPQPLGSLRAPSELTALLQESADAPMQREEAYRMATRDMLRHGGYKPTGRGKPASEYLVKAATEGGIGSINLAVDACNAVSLHSGTPISVVDLAKATGPFRIGIAESGTSYVFNRTGQEIDLGGLLCLFDSDGPCANPVRDSQRTKTDDETLITLSVLWGTKGYESRLDGSESWYRRLLEGSGATTHDVTVDQPPAEG